MGFLEAFFLNPLFQNNLQTLLIDHESHYTSAEIVERALGIAAQLPSTHSLSFVVRDSFKTLLLMLACWHRGIIFCPLSPRLPLSEVHIRAALAKAELFDGKIDWGRRVIGDFEVDIEAPATALFTSGSSGSPKLIQHTLFQHLSSARGVIDALSLDESTIWELELPLHHIAGIAAVIRTWVAGGSVLLPGSHRSFTHTSLVPTQLLRRLNNWEGGICILGGGPISQDLLDTAKAKGIEVHTSYGMTESASMIALDGKILPDRDVQIIDGEIVVSGEMVIGSPLKTGDRGYFEGDTLHIQGRLDNQFISGGENIQPEEIEEVLLKAGAFQAVVVDVPCDTYGARPFAFIKGDFDRDQLEKSLERFKIPVAFEPLTSSEIKPSRPSLRRRATLRWEQAGAFSPEK